METKRCVATIAMNKATREAEKSEIVELDRDVAEELVEYLATKRKTGGQFPMETWRAEADGVEHLLAALREALE